MCPLGRNLRVGAKISDRLGNELRLAHESSNTTLILMYIFSLCNYTVRITMSNYIALCRSLPATVVRYFMVCVGVKL